jgi:hypothetical protein
MRAQHRWVFLGGREDKVQDVLHFRHEGLRRTDMVAEGEAVRRGGRFGRILLALLVLAVLSVALWTWFSLSWA